MLAFSIKDEKAGLFSPPFFVRHAAMAVRMAEQACMDKKSNLGMYPEDFALYEVGEFDEERGTLDSGLEPVLVIKCSNIPGLAGKPEVNNG